MATPMRAISAENPDEGSYVRAKNRSSSSSNKVTSLRELPTPKSFLSKGRKQVLSDVANSIARGSGTRIYGTASGTKVGRKDPYPAVKRAPSNGSVSNEMPEPRKTIEARSAKAKTCLNLDSLHDWTVETMPKVERLASEMETMSLYNDYADDYDILPKEERLSTDALLGLRGLKPASGGMLDEPALSPPPSPPEAASFVTGLVQTSPAAQTDWKEYLVDAAVPALEDVVEEDEEDTEIENMFPHFEDDDDFDILPKEERLTEQDMAVLRDIRGRMWKRTASSGSSFLTPPPSPCLPFYIPPPCYEEFMLDLESLRPPFESASLLQPVE